MRRRRDLIRIKALQDVITRERNVAENRQEMFKALLQAEECRISNYINETRARGYGYSDILSQDRGYLQGLQFAANLIVK